MVADHAHIHLGSCVVSQEQPEMSLACSPIRFPITCSVVKPHPSLYCPGAQKEERSTWYPPIMREWLPRFSGELETTVILIYAAHPYTTESWEPLQLDIALFVQQSRDKAGTVGMALKGKQPMAILHVYNGKDMFV